MKHPRGIFGAYEVARQNRRPERSTYETDKRTYYVVGQYSLSGNLDSQARGRLINPRPPGRAALGRNARELQHAAYVRENVPVPGNWWTWRTERMRGNLALISGACRWWTLYASIPVNSRVPTKGTLGEQSRCGTSPNFVTKRIHAVFDLFKE